MRCRLDPAQFEAAILSMALNARDALAPGSHIEVKSTPGAGTCVSLFFPAVGTSIPEPNQSLSDQDHAVTTQKTCVLVVEDNQEMMAISSISLGRIGYQVITANTATQAVTQLVDNPGVRLAFIDIMLPDGMTGTELARTLVSLRPDLRVLFTTGYSDQKILEEALDISSVVRKPFDLKELKDKLALLTAGLDKRS